MISISKSSPESSSKFQAELSQLDRNHITRSELTRSELIENSDFIVLSQKLHYGILRGWEEVIQGRRDPWFNNYDVYDTLFLKEGMAALKILENCEDPETKKDSTTQKSKISQIKQPVSKPKMSNRAVSSNTSRYKNVFHKHNNPPKPSAPEKLLFLGNVPSSVKETSHRKIAKCNFTGRFTPKSSKKSKHRENSNIPLSFRHCVPAGSEVNINSFLNWAPKPLPTVTAMGDQNRPKSSHELSRGLSPKPPIGTPPISRSQTPDMLVKRQNQAIEKHNARNSGNVNENFKKPFRLDQKDKENSSQNSNANYHGYTSIKHRHKNGLEIKKFRPHDEIFTVNEFMEAYKKQIIDPELTFYNEIAKHLKYERYGKNYQQLKSIPIVLDSRASTPLMKMMRNENYQGDANHTMSRTGSSKIHHSSNSGNRPNPPTISIPTRKNDGNQVYPQFSITGVSGVNRELNRPQKPPNTVANEIITTASDLVEQLGRQKSASQHGNTKYRSEQNWLKKSRNQNSNPKLSKTTFNLGMDRSKDADRLKPYWVGLSEFSGYYSKYFDLVKTTQNLLFFCIS